MRKAGAAPSGKTLKLRSHGSYGSLCLRPIALGLAHRLLSLVQLLFGAGELVAERLLALTSFRVPLLGLAGGGCTAPAPTRLGGHPGEWREAGRLLLLDEHSTT